MIFEKKILKTFFPVIGILLIACGYMKFSFFYHHFDIRINNYLEFSEILTLFLPDIIKYGLIIFLIILFNFIFESKLSVERIHNLKLAITDSYNLLDRIKLHYLYNKELIWLSSACVINYLIAFIWFREKFLDILFITFYIPAFLIFSILLQEFKHKYKELYDQYLSPTYNNLILIFFLFNLYSIGSVYNEIKKVESGSKTIVTFEYSDENIKTDNNLIYIGQTSNYLFLHDKERKESKVFERSKLEKIIITPANNKGH